MKMFLTLGPDYHMQQWPTEKKTRLFGGYLILAILAVTTKSAKILTRHY